MLHAAPGSAAAYPRPVTAPVLITGAAGFIGGRLAERLRETGGEVRGIDRVEDRSRGIVAGDIGEIGAWRSAVEGCETVVHTAAVVSNAVGLDEQWRVNVLGTRNVLDAAIAAGARRFVNLSSVRAFGDWGFPDRVEESHPVRPQGIPYVDTKIAGEQVALQAHGSGEIEVVVIRPGDVYGPGSRPWTILPLEAIRSRRFVLPAMGRGIFSPVYVDNLVDGILPAIDGAQAAGQVFTLSDGVGVTCREFFGRYYRMLGRSGPPVLPTPLALAAVLPLELGARLRGEPTEVNHLSMRYLARDATYSIAKARRLLGYEPKVGLDEGMARTEAWLRAEGLLPPP